MTAAACCLWPDPVLALPVRQDVVGWLPLLVQCCLLSTEVCFATQKRNTAPFAKNVLRRKGSWVNAVSGLPAFAQTPTRCNAYRPGCRLAAGRAPAAAA